MSISSSYPNSALTMRAVTSALATPSPFPGCVWFNIDPPPLCPVPPAHKEQQGNQQVRRLARSAGDGGLRSSEGGLIRRPPPSCLQPRPAVPTDISLVAKIFFLGLNTSVWNPPGKRSAHFSGLLPFRFSPFHTCATGECVFTHAGAVPCWTARSHAWRPRGQTAGGHTLSLLRKKIPPCSCLR